MAGLHNVLEFAARYGRWCLIAGLFAGITLPDLAETLRPYLPPMIALLLFLAAFRIGPDAVLSGLQSDVSTLRTVLVYQIGLPLVALGVASLTGTIGTTAAIAAILMFAAPSITGSANFALLMRLRPDSALRLTMIGTALFPLTVLPILLLLPELNPSSVLTASARLIGVVFLAGGVAFFLRRGSLKTLNETQQAKIDGASALLLAIIVVGLMSAVGPLIKTSPLAFIGWALLCTALNFGTQFLAWKTLARSAPPQDRAAHSIVAGNRNVALFLVALPPEITNTLLAFIGCYQIPMYLTPILFTRLYRSNG
ncbi:MAG: hypothetical protein AAGF55_01970 [Pseudomonadota bacterium]